MNSVSIPVLAVFSNCAVFIDFQHCFRAVVMVLFRLLKPKKYILIYDKFL